MTLPLLRLAQAISQGGEAMNRAAGTGGGSGYQPLLLLADTDTGVINQTFTGVGIANAVDITSSSATISLNRAGTLFIASQILASVNAGTDYTYVYIALDGSKLGFNAVWDGTGAVKPFSVQTIIAFPLVAQGSHTIKLRGYVGAAANTGIVTEARTYVLATAY